MKKMVLVLFLLCTCGVLFLVQPTGAFAAPIVVTDGSTPQIAGDYTVESATPVSAPGRVLEILGGPQDVGGDLHFQGKNQNSAAAREEADNILTMGDIWQFLNDGGFTNVETLVVSFGVNETAGGRDYVRVEKLDIEVENLDSWSLGGGKVKVWNYGPGQSRAEALFLVDFGVNILEEYDADSTEEFYIHSKINWASDSYEIFMLEEARQVQIPDPAAMFLLGSACLVGFGGVRRKKFKM